ncbi:DUF5680 domain-containing protein [Patescibacteria group bacterium]
MTPPTIKEIMHIFFSAMKVGYAKDKTKGLKMPNLPMSRSNRFQEGDFTLLDYWFATYSQKSFGQTVIWYMEIPVWMMTYFGTYEEEAIPFLKKALYEAYKNDEFFGGRGPQSFTDDDMTYYNVIRQIGFDKFNGYEAIMHTRHGRSLGWHEYHGMVLL